MNRALRGLPGLTWRLRRVIHVDPVAMPPPVQVVKLLPGSAEPLSPRGREARVLPGPVKFIRVEFRMREEHDTVAILRFEAGVPRDVRGGVVAWTKDDAHEPRRRKLQARQVGRAEWPKVAARHAPGSCCCFLSLDSKAGARLGDHKAGSVREVLTDDLVPSRRKRGHANLRGARHLGAVVGASAVPVSGSKLDDHVAHRHAEARQLVGAQFGAETTLIEEAVVR